MLNSRCNYVLQLQALQSIRGHLHSPGAVGGTSLQRGSASAPVLVQTSILVALESA